MEARVDEIADRIYRISTLVPDVAPGGFTFNQFLIDGPEPLLFHTGMRQLFPLVRGAIETGDADRAAALDLVRPRRGRRVRGDERLPRRGPAGAGGAQRSRLHGLGERPRRSAAAPARRR